MEPDVGTLAFLLLHALKQLNSAFDSYVLCLLLSLDAQTLLRWWLWRNGR